MGNNLNKEILSSSSFPLKVIFIEFNEINSIFPFIRYKIFLSYQRYRWFIYKRFSEIKLLRKYLLKYYFHEVINLIFPKNYFQINSKPNKLLERGKGIALFIQYVASYEKILNDPHFRRFLEIGMVFFSYLFLSYSFLISYFLFKLSYLVFIKS